MKISKVISSLVRGARGFCPACGQGRIFLQGSKIQNHCQVCQIEMLGAEGDLWFFLLLLDRTLLIFPMVVMLFLGWQSRHPYIFYAAIGILAVVFLFSQKIRLGLCVALYQHFSKK